MCQTIPGLLSIFIFCYFFSGSVIGPTFHFDVPKLKFGTVSFGENMMFAKPCDRLLFNSVKLAF